tara:strand:- start:307 stop:426 length:120 start_codon:yes stop_codon:yes gene_type:complete
MLREALCLTDTLLDGFNSMEGLDIAGLLLKAEDVCACGY